MYYIYSLLGFSVEYASISAIYALFGATVVQVLSHDECTMAKHIMCCEGHVLDVCRGVGSVHTGSGH